MNTTGATGQMLRDGGKTAAKWKQSKQTKEIILRELHNVQSNWVVAKNMIDKLNIGDKLQLRKLSTKVPNHNTICPLYTQITREFLGNFEPAQLIQLELKVQNIFIWWFD